MRYKLRAGQRSSVYSPGQWVSLDYAKRYPHKVEPEKRLRKRRVRKLPLPARVLKPPKPPKQEWEVTATRRTRKKRRDTVVDVTFRVTTELPTTAEQVRKAVWAAVVHGQELKHYSIVGIDWRNEDSETGKISEFVYDDPETIDKPKEAARAVVQRTGLTKLRVAPVEA